MINKENILKNIINDISLDYDKNEYTTFTKLPTKEELGNIQKVIFKFNTTLGDITEYNITHLVLIDCNKNVDKLPKTLIYLYINGYFTQNIDHLPSNLLYLNLGGYFNKNIDNLPKSLKKLAFCNLGRFNKSVDKLPPNLESIYFSRNFNKSVDKLPNTIKTIKFGREFDKKVDNLPNELKNLLFLDYSCFYKRLDNLPLNLEYITLPHYYDLRIDFLPINLKYCDIRQVHFDIKHDFSNLPPDCVIIKN